MNYYKLKKLKIKEQYRTFSQTGQYAITILSPFQHQMNIRHEPNFT